MFFLSTLSSRLYGHALTKMTLTLTTIGKEYFLKSIQPLYDHITSESDGDDDDE